MKSLFELATGELSILKKVHLEPIMKGRHFDVLTLGDQENFEQVVVSILRDLMDEDPEELTMQELYHVWTFVKISTLGPTLSVSANCPKEVGFKDENNNRASKICNTLLETTIDLASESDICRLPKNYKVPSLDFLVKKEEGTKKYYFRPPPVREEMLLIARFQEAGVSRMDLIDLTKDLKSTFSYSKHRMLLHVTDEKGNFLFFNHEDREEAIHFLLEENPLTIMASFTRIVKELATFGVVTKAKDVVCSSCNSSIKLSLPLKSGLAF